MEVLGQEQPTSIVPAAPGCEVACAQRRRPRVALLSNPKSTGNLAQLPRIREFCASHPDVFHYEVEKASQISEAMRTIARVRPRLLVINGGDGTVQAALTELYNGEHFASDDAPPVAVLPSGKTNLIAMDLGVQGDPVDALEKLLEVARGDLQPHIVARELIALSGGADIVRDGRPVIGMFLGGAGLADVMLYCRHRIYPLGLPNSISHFITAVAVVIRQLFGIRASFLPPDPSPMAVTPGTNAPLHGRFSLLLVTTLEKLLLSGEVGEHRGGSLKFVAVEQRPWTLLRAVAASIRGRLGRTPMTGVHIVDTDDITIEGEATSVILDGETFRAEPGFPIRLQTARPLAFVRLAA